MKPVINISVLTILFLAASSPCFAMMSLEEVSKERAKELGMEIRTKGAGPNDLRVELEFATKGEFKDYGRVDLEINEGGKLRLFASLKEEQSRPGRVVVGFAADRTNLDKIILRVVVGVPRDMVGYDLRIKDFVDLEKLGSPTKAEQPPERRSLMSMISAWRYPDSTIQGATMSDGETVNSLGERTIPSLKCKTVFTTPDSIDKVLAYYKSKLKAAPKTAGEPQSPESESGRSVTFHDDSDGRPVALHVIVVNTEKSTTTLVISRGANESRTHVAWTYYARL